MAALPYGEGDKMAGTLNRGRLSQPIGRSVPELAAFDQVIQRVMERWDLPGGALAVSRDGRLVLSRGYGLADVVDDRPFEPSSRCRIASDTKPITAVAI